MELKKEEKPINLNTAKLSKRFVYEDYNLMEINLKLDSITGAILEDAEKQYREDGGKVEQIETDIKYAIKVAAMSAGIPAAVLKRLPVEDYYAAGYRVMNFLSRKVLAATKGLAQSEPLP